MNAPRRWVDDPEADETLREVLRGAPAARALDQLTRRRLRARVARASAVPALAAGWLFVKSAAAGLGIVLGAGVLAVSTGVIDWSPSRPVQSGPQTTNKAPERVSSPPVLAAPLPAPPAPVSPPESKSDEPSVKLNPAPSLPLPSASSAGTLSAEAALLEQARGQMRAAPSLALALAAEHARRFPHGQLASERALIQIEALHRLGRDAQARSLAHGLLAGAGAGLYAERVQQLLGENGAP
jgi:hypothetical protein